MVSGSLNFSGTTISGSVSFHTSNASSFVENYNKLDSASHEAPLVLNAPVAYDLSQVVVTIPSTPINKSADQLIASRNTLKKLFLTMQAFDYAEDVKDPGNKPWLDLIVLSEEDGEDSPGSVFIKWEFKNQAAIDAFEENELPAGFRLAPTQFLESDAPGYFVALNLYNAVGQTVKGARAEWDIFVQPPDGDQRPRYMLIYRKKEAMVKQTADAFRNRITIIGTVSRRIARLAKDPVLVEDARLLYQEVELLESHLERFEKYIEI